MNWADVHANLLASTKQRMKGLEDLQALIQEDFVLSREQLHDLVDAAGELLADNNHKVCQSTLTVLATIVQAHAEDIKPYTGILVPMVVERLGDARQAVRLEASGLLLNMMAHMPIGIVMEKMSRSWSHRSWKVKHGVLQTLAEAVSSGSLALQSNTSLRDHIVTSAVNMLEDKNENVRDAAQDLLQELYRDMGGVLLDNLQQQSIRPAVFRDLITRLDEVSPTNMTITDLTTAQAFPTDAAACTSGVATGRETAGGGPGTAARGAAAKRPCGTTGTAAAADVPAAAPVAPALVVSDRELHAELLAMVAPLSGTVVDWQVRIGHMQRMQALALGCPSHMHEVLVDALKPLRDSITSQVEDRRSSVSKQACQLLSTLSGVLGLRFQEQLAHFLPVLFKVLPITVQVMAEAADACCLSLLATCPSPKAICLLAQCVLKDKNAKIRSFCTVYLAHVLESWEPSTVARCTEEVEAAMKVACQDSAGEARAAARRMYAAYSLALPDSAAHFTRQAPANIIDKLSAGAAKATAPASRRAAASKPFLSRPSSSSSMGSCAADPDIIIVAPPTRPASAMASQRAGATYTPATNGPAQQGSHPPRHSASAGRVAVDMPPPPALDRRPAAARKSIAARVPGGGYGMLDTSMDATAALAALQLGQESVRPAVGRARRASIGTMPPYHPPPAPGAPQRVPAAPHPPTRPADRTLDRDVPVSGHAYTTSAPGSLTQAQDMGEPGAGSSTGRAGAVYTAATNNNGSGGGLPPTSAPGVPKPPSLARLVAALLSGQKPWNEKVDLLSALSEALRVVARGGEVAGDSLQALPHDPSRDMERLVPKLLESVEEAHVKVAVAGLTTLTDAIAACPHALEHVLDRILPSVFTRQQDSKDAVRVAATRVLHEVSNFYSFDQVLPGLLRSLDSSKQARVRQAVLEYGAEAMASATTRFSHGHTAAGASTTLLKQWLRAVSGLLVDKSLELRRAAGEAVRAAYVHVDADSVTAYIRHSTGAEGMALKRLLSEIEEGHVNEASASEMISVNVCGSARPASGIPSPAPGSSTRGAVGGVATVHASHGSISSRGGWSAAPSTVTKGAAGPRSYPLDLTSADLAAGVSGGGAGGLQLHCQQVAAAGPVYAPQGYMSPYKASDAPKQGSQSLASLPSDLGSSLLEEQGAYVVVAPVARAAAPVTTAASPGHWSAPCVSSSAPVALSQPVPADMAGQTRLLHLHITRLSGPSALEALQQLEALCMGKVSSSAWLARGQQLISELLRWVLVSPVWALREAGLRLVAGLARHQPLLLNSPPPGLLEELLPGLMDCAAAFDVQTSKSVFETLDALLDVLPLPQALSVLSCRLQRHSPPDLLPTAQDECVAIQRVVGRMSADQLVTGLPEQLVLQLQAFSQDGDVHMRKAAVYALAQLRLTLGECRFARFAGTLNVSQQQMVAWAMAKLQLASAEPKS